MTPPTGTSIVHGQDPETMPLTLRAPRTLTPPLSGDPVESVHEWYNDSRAKCGVWECTPGSFESAKHGDAEIMHFVAGEATITSADGTSYEVRPGTVIVTPDGWSGVWVIRRTVRKVYTIWKTTP